MKSLLWAVIFSVLSSCSILAQSVGNTTATVAGTVTDDAGYPLANVLITVAGQSGNKTTSTDSSGKFIFPYLVPSIYNIRAEFQGFTAAEQADVRIKLGQRLEISFQMKPAIHETVTVSGESRNIDLGSTSTGATVSDQLFQKIPIGRSINDIINLAPGVVKDLSGGNNLFISGGSRFDNSYIIDGAIVTNGFGGIGTISLNQNDGGLHSIGDQGLPLEAIKEVQIITGGFEPEYGESQGGIIRVITQSGSNNLHGEAYTYYTPQSSSNRFRFGDYGVDAGFSLGGPIKKNKLFFYGAYNLTTSNNTFLLLPNSPGYSLVQEVESKKIGHSYSLKFTATPNSQNTIEFSAFGDPSHSPLSNQDGYQLDTSINPKLAQSTWKYGSNTQSLRWSSILNSATFIEAQFARFYNEYINTPNPAYKGLHRVVDDEFNLDLSGMGGNIDFYNRNLQYSFKLTNVWKTHEFRSGVQFEDIFFATDLERTGGPLQMFDGRVATEGCKADKVPGEEHNLPELPYVFQAECLMTPSYVPTSTHYLNWFAQDSWNISPALNVTFGIRWELQHIQGDSSGATGTTFGNNWGPRIGASYDYRKSGNSKLFFHYGRFYEKIPSPLAIQFTPTELSYSYFRDQNLTQLIPDAGAIYAPTLAEREGIENSTSPYKTGSQYNNEWIVGVEQQIRGFVFSANVKFRNLKNVLDGLLVNPDQPCIALLKGGCVNQPLTLEEFTSVGNPGILITNFDGHIPGVPALTRNYKAVEISAEKRFSTQWQLLGSYRYARLIGNFEERDPFGLPFFQPGRVAVSPLTEYEWAEGPLDNDIRHMIKLFGSYQVRPNLSVGISIYFETGRPIRAFTVNDDLFYPVSARGAYGRTDSITSVDVNASYNIHVTPNQQITFGMDIFNLFNAQRVTAVEQQKEFYGEPYPTFLKPTAMQDPRSFRLLLRYSF